VPTRAQSSQTASPYLPSDAAKGCPYCFDPDSALLRGALTAPSVDPDALLPADALVGDLRFFHQLLRKQYAGYPDLLQLRDFDVEAFFSHWLETVAAAGTTISLRDGIAEPLIALQQIVPDRHLTFLAVRPLLDAEERLAFHEFQALLPASRAAAPLQIGGVSGVRPATLRRAPMLRADGAIAAVATVSASGTAAALHASCGGSTVELRRRPPTEPRPRPAQVPAYEWQATGVTAVITLQRFSGGPKVREQLSRFPGDYALHSTRPNVLFDLRGNGGGDLRYVDRWIAQAVRGTWQTYPRLEVVGALWPCSLWNATVEQQILDGTVDTAASRAERERLRAEWPVQPPPHTARLDPGVREGRGEHPYAGRVFVLVDRNSGSSGELAAVQLKRALGATVIGERTTGVMQYGEARRVVLPATGLVCQLPTKRFFFDEEVEAVGWPADVYLEDISIAADQVVPHLDRLHATLQRQEETGA